MDSILEETKSILKNTFLRLKTFRFSDHTNLRRINLSRITTTVSLTIYFLLVEISGAAYAQEKAYEEFTNIGPIAISNQYTLPEGRNAIIFRIRNNSSRTIRQLFGWVYLVDKLTADTKKKYTLINNPHQGGNVVQGQYHLPGVIAEWNFKLLKEPFLANQQVDYELRVNAKSVFFATIEPKLEKEEIIVNP